MESQVVQKLETNADVLLGEEIHDTAVVVTRYFGGTLLGTGGLVRAYSGSVQVSLAKIITKLHGYKLRIHRQIIQDLENTVYFGAERLSVLDSVY